MNGLPKILYDNRLADAAPVVSSTAAGNFSVLNLADFRPYKSWKPTAMPATVTVDSGAVKSADSLVVWGHDLGSLAGTVEVRRSNDNFAANDVLVATHAPSTNKPFLRQFVFASDRYWRLRLTGAAAPTLAIAALGVGLEFPRRLTRGFDPLGRRLHGQTNRSETGLPLGKVIDFEEWSERISLRNLDWAWIRANWLPAWNAHLRASPFVIAWDPVDHADELRLVAVQDRFSAPHQAGQFANLDFEVSGLIA